VAQIDITINGRTYPVGCEDGQEARLQRLAAYVDGKVTELAESVGPVGDTRLLVMASLLLADELADAARDGDRLRIEAQQAARAAEERANAADLAAARTMEELASRLESIALRLEKA
jgi:cell division protein ZapA